MIGQPRSAKGEQTKSAIFEAALELFQKDGYEAATMRAIAARAGVSLGSSYHYFPSKEHLVLEFYQHTHRLHEAACAPILSEEKDLALRLRAVVRAVVLTCEPFHAVAGSIFSTVANPASPLNPFGSTASLIREEVIELYAKVLKGSNTSVPADLATELPRLLWLYQMGILYFWILDPSPNRLRTLELIDETSDLIVRLLNLAGLPGLRKSRRRISALIQGMLELPPPTSPMAKLP
ncbi:MAG TPA: TetR family transcriptional regulator [Candidatus Dormibacteraeota bacterium]|jgi:AcrR family transcriptional regulator|nr:TetR family transcriptional regulator [Candidatus Dormibacteraeota bacterium]